MPGTNKKSISVCGLKRKCNSELWRTKGEEERGQKNEKRHVSTWNSWAGGAQHPALSSTVAIWSPLWSSSLDCCGWLFPDCPHLTSELSFTFKCHHYCVPWALLSAQEAGLVFSLQLVLKAGSSPSSWALGNSDREFSMLGPGKLGMSNNPLVTRIRFHWLYGNCLHVLEGSLPLPNSPHSLDS